MGGWASGNHPRAAADHQRTAKYPYPRHHRTAATVAALDAPRYCDIARPRVRGDKETVIFGWAVGVDVLDVGQADIVYSRRKFGGRQAYCQCECGKRVTALYIGGSSIACRHCLGLLYDSQFGGKHEQPAAKAAKLRTKLGNGPALLELMPDKPKHMHRETYDRFCYQILTLGIEAAARLKQYREERWLPILFELERIKSADY